MLAARICWLFFGAMIFLEIMVDFSGAKQQEETQFMWRSIEDKASHNQNEGDLSVRTKPAPCKRHPLQFQLTKLYGKAIIAPHSFQGYKCSGECPSPISNHMNTTNHAILQKHMSEVYRGKWPSPCCVPTTLKPMAVLWVDKNDVVKHEKFENMIVEGCGCR